MKRPITAAIFALALTTTAAIAQQPAAQQPAAKPATQQPAAKPTTAGQAETPAPTKTGTRKHKKHTAKTTGATRTDSSSSKPKK
jgi:hypothetical protein